MFDATGTMPRGLAAGISITVCVDVWFCWLESFLHGGVYVPHQGAAVPDSRSLSWSFTFSLVFVALAGSCFSRLPALARVPMGSSFTHERSTTFPWVSSRPVQRGYDLSGLRGPVVKVYQNNLSSLDAYPMPPLPGNRSIISSPCW